jgi:hypothetical protein
MNDIIEKSETVLSEMLDMEGLKKCINCIYYELQSAETFEDYFENVIGECFYFDMIIDKDHYCDKWRFDKELLFMFSKQELADIITAIVHEKMKIKTSEKYYDPNKIKGE